MKIRLITKTYLKILEKTQGTWASDDWPETARKRRKIELAASRRRKAAWLFNN